MTPIIKNINHERHEKHERKGLAPITKNGMISIVDEQGNELGVTYYKRAKGMVKNGRARYIDDNKIIMFTACPPDKTEDSTMNEYINEVRDNDGNLVKPMWKEAEADEMASVGETVTIADMLKRIDAIIADSEHLAKAIEAISSIETKDVQHGSQNAGMIAHSIRDSIKAREETNHRILSFLNRVYDDIQPSVSFPGSDMGNRQKMMDILSINLEHATKNHNTGAVGHILNSMKELCGI